MNCTTKDSCIAITICINYSDYLKYVINNNSIIFKKIIVITTTEDIETINLISESNLPNVELMYTKKLHQKGYIFNKSAMIREAQKYINKVSSNTDWICLLDADIYVPIKLSEINLSELNNKYIYGIRRVLDNGKINKNNTVIGFFQLYYKRKLYRRNSKTAAKCDIYFALSFGKKYQKYFDELKCRHIGPTNTNWEGRISEKFVLNESIKLFF